MKISLLFGIAAPHTPLNPAPIRNFDVGFVFRNEISSLAFFGEKTDNGVPERPE